MPGGFGGGLLRVLGDDVRMGWKGDVGGVGGGGGGTCGMELGRTPVQMDRYTVSVCIM